jgi:PPOX class probable F420-dependent enzyme
MTPLDRPVPAWAAEMLAAARVGRLATAGADGRPLVVPICYVFDGARVYSAVDAKPKRTRELRRLHNIEVNPLISLVVDEYDEDWTRLRYVIVEGHADVLHDGDEFARAIDLLVAKYPQYESLSLSRDTGALIRIVPARILTWRFRGV